VSQSNQPLLLDLGVQASGLASLVSQSKELNFFEQLADQGNFQALVALFSAISGPADAELLHKRFHYLSTFAECHPVHRLEALQLAQCVVAFPSFDASKVDPSTFEDFLPWPSDPPSVFKAKLNVLEYLLLPTNVAAITEFLQDTPFTESVWEAAELMEAVDASVHFHHPSPQTINRQLHFPLRFFQQKWLKNENHSSERCEKMANFYSKKLKMKIEAAFCEMGKPNSQVLRHLNGIEEVAAEHLVGSVDIPANPHHFIFRFRLPFDPTKNQHSDLEIASIVTEPPTSPGLKPQETAEEEAKDVGDTSMADLHSFLDSTL
jgi:hypothetical protein